ncbi:unnamed protein product [Moneuplotes crassus]|uniref:Uncharacterized protein n=1 Tax=Euplotes crassus TaxID=5936 RepID=A0AAD1UAT1_EUPCR|nr:unnamed protein product [Moneuplotes crassus]
MEVCKDLGTKLGSENFVSVCEVCAFIARYSVNLIILLLLIAGILYLVAQLEKSEIKCAETTIEQGKDFSDNDINLEACKSDQGNQRLQKSLFKPRNKSFPQPKQSSISREEESTCSSLEGEKNKIRVEHYRETDWKEELLIYRSCLKKSKGASFKTTKMENLLTE